MLKYKRQRSEHFEDLCTATRTHNEDNDCGVKALAVLAKVSYEDAHSALSLCGRINRRGCSTFQLRTACRLLGYDLQEIDPWEMIKKYRGSYPSRLCGVTTYHPNKFPEAWKDGETYLLFTRRHVVAVKNGETIDWTTNRSLRVTWILKAIKIN